MAAYGTLAAWADSMGHTDAAALLRETLEEEKAADEKLTSIAEGGVNEQASEGSYTSDDESGEDPGRETAAAGARKGARTSAAKSAWSKRR
jgi:rubrerythrin